MCRSIRSLNTCPPKWTTHGLVTIFNTWRVGDLNLIVCLAEMRNLSQKCQVFPAELGVNALNMEMFLGK